MGTKKTQKILSGKLHQQMCCYFSPKQSKGKTDSSLQPSGLTTGTEIFLFQLRLES